MANTYGKLFLQSVFAVKYRQALLTRDFSERLYDYMGGIIRAEGQQPIRIGGYRDHVHIAFAMKPSHSVSDLMRVVKANSSKWINEMGFTPHKFRWQRGYGIFSYGKSQLPRLIRYIENQEEHHRKKTFREEYIGFLKAFEVEYKDEFLFDWILDKEKQLILPKTK